MAPSISSQEIALIGGSPGVASIAAKPHTVGIGVAVVSADVGDARPDAIARWLAARGFIVAMLRDPAAADRSDRTPQLLELLRQDDRVVGPPMLVALANSEAFAALALHDTGATIWLADDSGGRVNPLQCVRPLQIHRYRDDPPLQRLVADGATNVERHEYARGTASGSENGLDRLVPGGEIALLRAADFMQRAVRCPSPASVWTEHIHRLARRNTQVLATLHDDGYLHYVPLGRVIGPAGNALAAYYSDVLLHQLPADLTRNVISQNVCGEWLVEEAVLRFTHSRVMDWIAPGLTPTGRIVELAVVSIIRVKAGRIREQRVHWDHAALLAQLDARVDVGATGAATARLLLDVTGTTASDQVRVERRPADVVVHGYHRFVVSLPGLGVTSASPVVHEKAMALASMCGPVDLTGRHVLDLGAHHGFFSVWALARGARRVTAVDRDEHNVAIMRELRAAAAIESMEVHVADALQWRPTADVVLALGLLPWLCASEPPAALPDVIARLAALADESLVIEWIEPDDATVTRKLRTPLVGYQRDVFERSLASHFPCITPASSETPTRCLYRARRGA